MKRYVRAGVTIEDLSNLRAIDLEHVADDPNTSPEVLARLAEEEGYWYRFLVAKNPNTSLETLEMLANDNEEVVRKAVAKNRNTPAEILMKLAEDSYWSVRESVVNNPNTPIEVLAMLAKDPDRSVRAVVAENPNTPSEIGKKQTKSSSNWESFQEKLEDDCEYCDPLYEQTSAGSKLEGIMQEVEDTLGIWLEPSIQGGRGGIWIYSSDNDEVLAEGIDYQDFNDQAIDLALTSNSKAAFKNAYKNMLEGLIS